MARSFTIKEAKELVEAHKELQTKLETYSEIYTKKKQEIEDYIKEFDLYNIFSQYMLKCIMQKTEIPIDSELKQLILKLYVYKEDQKMAEKISGIKDQPGKEIAEKMRELSRFGTMRLQWIFATKNEKKKTEDNFYKLKEALSSSYTSNIINLEEEINQFDEFVDEKFVDDEFEINKKKYYDTLLTLDLERASRLENVNLNMIISLIERYKILSEKLDTIEQEIDLEKQKTKIHELIKSLAEEKVISELQNMPIDELNRDGNGIRIKTLKNAGYHNIESVYKESPNRISSIYGISGYATSVIKKIANDYAEQLRSSVKIQLNYDNKTEKSTKLVYNIYKYYKQKNIIAGVNTLKTNDKKNLEIIQYESNIIRFFFKTSREKQEVIDAFYLLSNDYDKKYKNEVSRLTKEEESISKASQQEAWDDFNNNSIIYYSIIEELAPGVLGNDDEKYGLSETLSNEVEKEEISLDGLKCELRRYQLLGVKYILHQQKVLLGDEMGLGKTIQAMACLVSLRNTGKKYFMVICPASVLPNWCKEISLKSDLDVIKIHGKDKQYALELWKQEGGVAVTTYETTAYCQIEGFRIDMLVVDEAHYIKNPLAARTMNVISIGNHADRMLFMTGTALENKVMEMINIIDILQPKIARDLLRIAHMSHAKQFREKIAPVYYRRKREDVLTELPDLIENDEWCEMSSQEKMKYEEAVFSKKYVDVRRVSWNVEDLNYSSKAKRLKEIVNEAKEDGRKIIVFSFFLDTIQKIQRLFTKSCMQPINGSVPVKRRQEIIEEFNNAPAGTVLPAQILSAGTGLNIQSASVVVICEPQFKPSIENQAISRAYRMGQARNVHVHRLLCIRTVDERIRSVLNSKQYIFDTFADKSVAAERTMEIDNSSFGEIVDEEIERINAERKGMKHA